MKAKLSTVILIVLLNFSCYKEKSELIKEVPDNIIRTETCPTLYDRIEELLPYGIQVSSKYPAVLSDTVQKNIVLKRASEVYITFIDEDATFKNTVGWYAYPLGSKPKSIGEIKLHILFPNVSRKGEGGELEQGDMLQLGDSKFPENTVIGFFLIVNGWQNGSIDYRGTTHFTDYYLNSGGYQQHVLFKEKNCGDIIMGFEDRPISVYSDFDYNDILFTISDNRESYETVSFDVQKMPVL